MNNFRKCREKAGLSQKEAAITLGVKPPSMSAWESGKNFPTIENLIAMANLYNVTLDMLLGVEREPAGVAIQVTEDERDVLLAYRQATPEIRGAVRAVLGVQAREVEEQIG